jgi:hypothetical protein
MKQSLPTVQSLNEVRIASPCPAAWDKMRGNEQVRFCGQCQQNVYNLSEMTTVEAAQVLNREERRPCVRFFMRKDGSPITAEYQAGLRWEVWKRLRKRLAWAASLFAVLFLPGCGGGGMVMKPPQTVKGLVNDGPKNGGDNRPLPDASNQNK